MVDNFDKIKELISFNTDKEFYFIQVLKRRKDNPDLFKDVVTINNYFCYSYNDFDKFKEKIINDCDTNNARCYINLNRLDGEKVALTNIELITKYLLQGNYHSVKNAYVKACGNTKCDDNKKWVVDVDQCDLPNISDIIQTIESLHSEIKNKDYKIIDIIPTQTGKHIITNPFNMQKFSENYPEIMVNSNSPTVLYIP